MKKIIAGSTLAIALLIGGCTGDDDSPNSSSEVLSVHGHVEKRVTETKKEELQTREESFVPGLKREDMKEINVRNLSNLNSDGKLEKMKDILNNTIITIEGILHGRFHGDATLAYKSCVY